MPHVDLTHGVARAHARRVCSTLLVVATLVTTGCVSSGSLPTRSPSTARGQPSAVFALVKRGAWLYAAPRQDAHRAHDPLFAHKPYQLGRAVTFQVLERQGAWLQVRPITRRATRRRSREERDNDPCVAGLHALRHLDLRLFVRVTDVVPAILRETRYVYRDHTAVTLRAGVPAVRRRQGVKGASLVQVRTGRFRLTSFVRDKDVGRYWRRSPAFHNAESDERVANKAELRFGGTGRVMNLRRYSWLYIQAREPGPKLDTVVVRDTCSELRVKVRPEDVTPVSPSAGGLGLIGMSSGRGSPWFKVPADAPLTWTDGRPAGQTTAPLVINRDPASAEEVPGSDDLRRCFRWSLRTWWGRNKARPPEAYLTLCAPRALIEPL